MAKATLELIAKTDNWTGGLKKAQSAMHNFETTGKGLNQALSQNKQVFVDAVRKMGDMESKASTASGRLREMENMFMELGDAYRRMSASMKADDPGKVVLEQMDKIKASILAQKQNMQQLQGQLALPGAGGAGFGKQLLNGIAPGLGMGVGAAGVMVAIKAMQALKEQVVDTVRVNMDFEQSNANLSAILGKTSEQIYELTENAKALGGSTIYTASQISELQTVLSRRGFNEGQILNMTHGIANLATATGTDLAQSAELAASTMQAFGLKAADMERIVSVLGVSTTKSALTTEKLGVSLQYVAPTARAAGFSLEETVAMLGALVDAGLDASTAGTSLRQIILGMSTTNGKLANSFGHPIRGLKDFTESIRKMKEDGNASLDEISKKVRVTAVPAFLSLVENADRLEELRESITGVEDELQAMADKQIDTAKGAVIIFKSALEGLKLTFDESNGAIKDGIQWLTKYINKWKEYRQLEDGGQGAVNAMIGDEEKFRKETQERAKKYVEQWNADEMQLVSRGTRVISEDGTMGEGLLAIPYSRTIDHSQYRTAKDEATARLKEQKELYDKLIPLSKQYADYRDGNVSPYTPAAIRRWGAGKDAKAKIEELTEQSWNYDSFQKYLTNMYKDIKMYEAVVNAAGTDNFGGVLVEDEASGGETTGTVTIVERARDIEKKALLRYDQELKELQNRLRAGLIDQAEFDKRKVGLDENVWEAYGRADMLEPMKEWKDGMAKWEKTMMDDADVAGLSDTTKKLVQAKEKYTRALELASMEEKQGLQDSISTNKKILSAKEGYWRTVAEINTETGNAAAGEKAQELAAEIVVLRNTIREQENKLRMRKDDETILGALETVAKRNGKDMSAEQLGGKSVFEYFGLTGMRERMNADLELDITPEEWQKLVDEINEKLSALKLPKIELDVEAKKVTQLTNEVKDMATQWGYVTSAISSVGQALNTIEDPGAKVAGTIAQAVATIAMGFATASAASSKYGVLPWIAATAAGIATMASTIASIKSITAEYHADGGFVGGGPRGTDTVNTWLTPGELVLNRAQQNNLAAQLQPAQMFNPNDFHLETEIRADKFRVMLLQNDRRRGGTGNQYRIK